MPGRWAASQIAAASAASFLLDFTNGRTNWAAMSHILVKACQHAGPVMGAATSLHDDAAGWPVSEERHELGTFESLAVDRASIRIHEVNLENALGKIDGYGRGFHLFLLGGRTAEPAMSHAQDARLRRRTVR